MATGKGVTMATDGQASDEAGGQPGGAGRGRPRRAETDERIVSATLELIREQGPDSVNVASVAARSGIARTTIYRRYRDRRELLAAALQPVTEPGTPPEGASVREKLGWLLARTEEVLARSIGLGGVAAVVAGSDPEFGAALRTSLDAALEPIMQQIADDVAHRRLSPEVDPDIVVNLVLGAYLAEVVRHGAPRADWLPRTADLLAVTLSPGS
jgi:AcrR family transcriptional regulator